MRVPTLILTAFLFGGLLVSCTDPFGPTEGRPGIPMPESYEEDVPLVSDILVIAEATARSFEPLVDQAYAADGTNYGVTPQRVLLIEDGVTVTDPTAGGTSVQALPGEDLPTLQCIRYWRRISDVESFAGGAAVTRETTTTTGSSQTSTQTFSQTLSIEAEASYDGLFVSGSVKTTASVAATHGFSSTTSTEESVTKTFTVSPIAGTNLLYSVWQLVEEFRYVNGTGADAPLYDVQAYNFDGTSLRFIFPTDEIVPISAYYEQ